MALGKNYAWEDVFTWKANCFLLCINRLVNVVEIIAK